MKANEDQIDEAIEIPKTDESRHADAVSARAGWFFLTLLVLQNSSVILTLRYSRLQDGDRYFPSTSVMVGEVLKVFVCVVVIMIQHRSKAGSILYSHLFMSPVGLFKISVPSMLYALQNNLQYYSLTNLAPPQYQVLNQFKIFTTAIFSVLMLRKELSKIQWLSLFVLFAGVCLVQLDVTDTQDSQPQGDTFYGSIAAIALTIISGFAGVYLEKMLKGPGTSMWVLNFQLAIVGIFYGGVIMYLNDYEQIFISGKGFFFGWNRIVVAVILLHVLGGFVTASVVKYLGSIQKGFAVAVSTALSTGLSCFFFDFALSMLFVVGAAMVIASVIMYMSN